jgi:drug/metabolite transporter (DMT)-like permease
VILTGIASCLEKPVGNMLDAFQLNLVIRTGTLILGAAALLLLSGAAIPSVPSLLAALGIGVLTGAGSVAYCFAVDRLPLSLVVSVANTYILVTVVLGLVVLHEGMGLFTVVGLVGTIAGVLVLSVRPRSAVSRGGQTGARTRSRLAAYGVLAANVVLIGAATFLEKPALEHGLSPLQLNAFQTTGTFAVAVVAVLARRQSVPVGVRSWEGVGLGAAFGLAAICYFLGLRRLPVSIAATLSNSYVVLTVLASVVLLHESLTWRRVYGLGITLAGVLVLAAFGT